MKGFLLMSRALAQTPSIQFLDVPLTSQVKEIGRVFKLPENANNPVDFNNSFGRLMGSTTDNKTITLKSEDMKAGLPSFSVQNKDLVSATNLFQNWQKQLDNKGYSLYQRSNPIVTA
jgi:hypothetical protein